MSAEATAAHRTRLEHGKTLASVTAVRMVGTSLPARVRCPFAAFFT